MSCIDIVAKAIEISVPPLATLAAAYFGAKYAFSLQSEKEKRVSIGADVKAANGAIFELGRTYNKFLAIKRQFIDEHRSKPGRHIQIMPVAGMSWDPPTFSYDDLSFLFKSSDPNLLGTLSLVEQEIASTLDLIRQRSEMHVDVLQPVVEGLSKEYGEQVSVRRIEAELGERLTATLKMTTDYMIQGVDNVIAGCLEHMDRIRAETHKIYPGHVVIKITAPKSDRMDCPAP